MELAEARALVQDKTDKDITARHLISVEGVMRALARRFGEDEHRWALAGLFHDLDQDQTGEDSDRHAYLAAEWLREARGVEEPVIKKKLKERSFAPGVNRVEVYGAEKTLGLPLEEFLAVAIEGLQQVAPEVGLQDPRDSPAAGEVSDLMAAGGHSHPTRGEALKPRACSSGARLAVDPAALGAGPALPTAAAQRSRPGDGLGAVGRPELVQDVGDVALDGVQGDHQLLGDHLVGLAVGPRSPVSTGRSWPARWSPPWPRRPADGCCRPAAHPPPTAPCSPTDQPATGHDGRL
jgi:putative nucleotidyltransferase with HDIG domain